MIQKESCYLPSELTLISNIDSTIAPKQTKSILLKDLETQIMKIVTIQEQKEVHGNPYLQSITKDLQIMNQNLQEQANYQNLTQLITTRMHQLAIAKIMVFTHGKSDFRLVSAHFAIGKVYLETGCYEQAVDHLTIASTKLSKMGDIKQTKIYNSYILTSLARCYLSLQGYNHALELLLRAEDIQGNNQNIKGSSLAQQTLQLLAKVYLKLNLTKDAIKKTDKLIDTLKSQRVDFEDIFMKLKEQSLKDRQSDQPLAVRLDIMKKKGSQYIQLIKPFESLMQKLEYLIVQYDRKWLRDYLPYIVRQVQTVLQHPQIFQEVLNHLEAIVLMLEQELKRVKIFVFKIYLQGEGEYLTNTVDQELKNFLKQYQENDQNSYKVLTHTEHIDLYKLLVHYCTRFSDHDTQLQYLHYLENILKDLDENQSKMELLKVKRNISMIYNQKRMISSTIEELKIIKKMEKELFGRSSEVVKKTNNMLRVLEEDQKKNIGRMVRYQGSGLLTRNLT